MTYGISDKFLVYENSETSLFAQIKAVGWWHYSFFTSAFVKTFATLHESGIYRQSVRINKVRNMRQEILKSLLQQNKTTPSIVFVTAAYHLADEQKSSQKGSTHQGIQHKLFNIKENLRSIDAFVNCRLVDLLVVWEIYVSLLLISLVIFIMGNEAFLRNLFIGSITVLMKPVRFQCCQFKRKLLLVGTFAIIRCA